MPITMKVTGPTADDHRFTIRLVDRNGQTDAAIEALLLQVYERVNPAVGHDPTGSVFPVLFKDGPVLFNVAVAHEQTGRTTERLAGLKVSPERLQPTLTALADLGIEVQQ